MNQSELWTCDQYLPIFIIYIYMKDSSLNKPILIIVYNTGLSTLKRILF